MQVGVLAMRSQYIKTLRSPRFYTLQSHNSYVVADCDASGNLKQGYCLFQKMNFDTEDGGSFDLLKCSCSTSKQQRAQLDAFPKRWRTDVDALILQEKADYCVLMEEDEDWNDKNDSEEELIVDILCLDPSLVAVYDGHSYGLAGYKRTSKLQCLFCDHRCHHVRHLKDWCDENDVHLDKKEPLMKNRALTLSYRPIPYPLPLHHCDLHDKHERGGVEFPIELVPS